MRDKKAMSEVVTTIIMVVLALVAVAVIWQIINNLISNKGAQIGITQKCLDVKLSVTTDISKCDPEGCDITITRAAGGDNFDGIKVVFKGSETSSEVITIPGNIEQLASVTPYARYNDGDSFEEAPNKVEVTAYFNDESGIAQNCPAKAEYNF